MWVFSGFESEEVAAVGDWVLVQEGACFHGGTVDLARQCPRKCSRNTAGQRIVIYSYVGVVEVTTVHRLFLIQAFLDAKREEMERKVG